jgi:hypothetical protein
VDSRSEFFPICYKEVISKIFQEGQFGTKMHKEIINEQEICFIYIPTFPLYINIFPFVMKDFALAFTVYSGTGAHPTTYPGGVRFFFPYE